MLVAAAALAGLVLSVPAARADWSADGHADVLAVDPGERLYRGNGGSWLTGTGEPIGSGSGTRPSRAAS